MLANVTGFNLKDSSAGYWTFAERLLACEINFRHGFLWFSVLSRFRLTLLEFKADIFFVGQYQKRFERPALAGNESFKQIRFSAFEQFVHLFSLDWSLQNDFSRSEVTVFVWA